MSFVIRGCAAVLRARSPAGFVAQTLLVKVLVIGISLATGIVTARTLGPAGRGAQGAIGIWPWLIAGLSSFGIPSALRYHSARSRNENVLGVATMLAAVSGACGAIVGVFVIPIALGQKYGSSVVIAAEFVMVFVPVYAIFRVFCSYYEAQGDFTKSNASMLTSPVITLASLGALAFAHRLTPFAANLAVFGPLTLQTAILGFRLRKKLFAFDRGAGARLTTIVSYGVRSYGSDIMTVLSAQADQAVIIGFLSPSALGLYAVAIAASRTLNIFVDSIETVLFPTASSVAAHLALDMVARAARLSAILSGAAAAVAIVIVPWLIGIFYGSDFAAAANVARVLLFEAFLRGQSSVLLQGFLATNRPGAMTIVQAGWLVASLLLLALCVPKMGIDGAAYALVFSSLIRLAVILACYPLVLGAPVPNLVPRKPDFRYLAAKLLRFADA